MPKRTISTMSVMEPAPTVNVEFARGLLYNIGMEMFAPQLSAVGHGTVEAPDSYGNLVYSYPVVIDHQPTHVTATVRRRHPDLTPPYNNFLLVMHYHDGDIAGCTRYSS